MNETLGPRLKRERERLGLTQPVFAELGGIKRATQHLYEQDKTAPDTNYLLALDKHGVDVAFLLFGESRKGVGSFGVTVNVAALSQLYRAVDRFAVDDSGVALSAFVRERIFVMLAVAVSQGSVVDHPDRIQNEIEKLLNC